MKLQLRANNIWYDVGGRRKALRLLQSTLEHFRDAQVLWHSECFEDDCTFYHVLPFEAKVE
jgi:hypothetical protein